MPKRNIPVDVVSRSAKPVEKLIEDDPKLDEYKASSGESKPKEERKEGLDFADTINLNLDEVEEKANEEPPKKADYLSLLQLIETLIDDEEADIKAHKETIDAEIKAFEARLERRRTRISELKALKRKLLISNDDTAEKMGVLYEFTVNGETRRCEDYDTAINMADDPREVKHYLAKWNKNDQKWHY